MNFAVLMALRRELGMKVMLWINALAGSVAMPLLLA
jgi:hypothetical protein